ncbi:MAG: autotransporter [Bdellovibrionia bacterium]
MTQSVMFLRLFLFLFISACAHSDVHSERGKDLGSGARPAPVAQGTESGWPQTYTSDNKSISVYPPQVEEWSGDDLKERAAVSVQTSSSAKPIYGLIWISAKTSVDPKTHRVSFDQVHVTKAQFPSAPELSASSLKTLRQNESGLLKPVALESLQSNLAIARAESEVDQPKLRNGPPKIVFKKTPTLLVLIDGAPALRDSGASGVMRVINTRALILYDSSKSRYYFYMGDRWMDALSLSGPWIESDQVSPEVEQAKNHAVQQNQVDLLNDPNSALMKKLAQHEIPQVYVSTEPTEVLQTEGKPQLQSIAGTKLLFVSNSENSIFLDQHDQNYYVLLSGRWYRAKSLDGPWRYVPANKLSKDFAKIPENHRKGSVLASVPGTQQAGEAKISNEVPQTAKVDRNQAALEVKYDGEPQFKPIEQTSLQYAENSKTPVIQVDSKSYFALQSGVWFESNSPQGPWKVAARVPAVIYTIPSSSPVYYVTYVRIYDATPDAVYVGYTPGYLGSYCCSDGVVVYGTGYYYPPWIGTYWIGPPVTFGVGFYWGYGGGFYAGPAFYPWWGPWWSTPVYIGYPYSVTGAVPVGQGTVYQGWSSAVVQTQNPAPFQSAYLGSGGTWGPASEPPAASAWNPSAPQAPAANSAHWGVGQQAGAAAAINGAAPAQPAPAAPAAPAIAPPPAAGAPAPAPMAPPPAPAAPPPAAGNAGAISQGFHGGGGGGGGWGPAHR